MKVLIIEDDLVKLENIISTLNVFSELIISSCDNIFEGKEMLSKHYYDLLILDMNLPFDKDDEAEDYAGYNLFKELQRVSHLKKPGEMIMLTSYDNLHNKYKSEVEKGLFTIIKFDSLSNTWCEQITRKIKYLLSSALDANDTSSTGYNFDVAIITATSVEHKQIVKMLNDVQEYKINGDSTYYVIGRFEEIKDKKIVVATQHQMGMTAAAVLTTKIINNFKPRLVGMVGIAAGIKGQGDFGDIIIPTEIWDYTSGKVSVTENDTVDPVLYGDIKFEPEPKYLAISSKIKEIVNKNYTSVLHSIQSNWNESTIEREIKIIPGPMACGSIVVQHEKLIDRLIVPHNRKIKGVDMESYGVVYAVENAYSPKPEVIICKSISDFGDSNKGDEFQNYAAYTSSSFFSHLLKSGLLD